MSRPKINDDISYTEIESIIREWIVGRNAERDREIMGYWLLDGLSYNQIARRYQDRHPDDAICEDTVKRVIKARKQNLFKHFPGE